MAAIGRFQKGDDIFYAKVVDGELFKLQGDVFGSPSFEKKPTPVKGVKTLTPVAPSKIIAVGLNYADHARESGKPLPKEPLIWFKATTSLLPDGGKIEIPFADHVTHYEAELAIVIGRRVRNVTPAAAARYIFGYTAAQDISDRTIQNSESQWARAKPLGAGSTATRTPVAAWNLDDHATASEWLAVPTMGVTTAKLRGQLGFWANPDGATEAAAAASRASVSM